MATVGLYTLGCKVAQYETEAIGEAFVRHGYVLRDFSEPCDFYVVNTCTVTAESDRKCRQMIRRAHRTNPAGKILVVGCYSQRAPEAVAALPGVAVTLGTAEKMTLPDLADKILSGDIQPIVHTTDVERETFEPMCITHAPRTRAYVKIEDGCECRCTYCAISRARGRVRSKAPEDVIAEVEALARAGTREVVLTGIETGSYGKDHPGGVDLAGLLSLLDARKSCERIRLGSLAPELCGADFVTRVRTLSILAPHFHLSLQSGSDKVLAAMRRRYNAAQALRNIEALREAIPGVTFTTDIMVGFPGETEEDFLETVAFVKRAGFLACHVFAYSRRAGTPADGFPDQVPEEIKRDRSERMIRAAAEVQNDLLSEIVRKKIPLSCVFETSDGKYYTAHAASYIEVRVPDEGGAPLHGEIRTVLPASVKDGVVYGNIVESSK